MSASEYPTTGALFAYMECLVYAVSDVNPVPQFGKSDLCPALSSII